MSCIISFQSAMFFSSNFWILQPLFLEDAIVQLVFQSAINIRWFVSVGIASSWCSSFFDFTFRFHSDLLTVFGSSPDSVDTTCWQVGIVISSTWFFYGSSYPKPTQSTGIELMDVVYVSQDSYVSIYASCGCSRSMEHKREWRVNTLVMSRERESWIISR